ncbi:hydroxypyruvate isomerase [Aquimarina sp. AD10]|uniref:hydroxypyruvate isomerase family protein n=1 Tax=Aquimarina sp. AD10 TaxID=1714849 RepID=UPI000E54EA45|nr:TIM barrel protein [Aquimarina sp. AD10]AXT58904.1 hydroxypyruvate isomerase [Aquimarina sp. AD10]RKM99620.1 hydroxypyruvate isomerase [Aquimarina sp. AD10]
MSHNINRRKAVKNISISLGAIGLTGTITASSLEEKEDNRVRNQIDLKGNINHAACRWCYQDIPLQEFAEKGKDIGLKAIDLLKPEEWQTVQSLGLECSLATDTFASITDGFNNPKYHEKLQKQYLELISKASYKGIKQVIVFSGNRNGISEEMGLEQSAKGLDILVKHAEKNNVTLVMELLNSKVDHKDYQCDHTPWGISLVDKIGSNNFKLLYDIYHMQIMEGDIIATINKYNKYIGHYHTGGVPGRNEIGNKQELNYPAIMKAIVKTDFKGYIAQEFIPTYPDKLAALKEGIAICDV